MINTNAKIAAVVLAAGRGKRMKSLNRNKVTLEIGGVPMIKRSVSFLKQMGINVIIVVVGFSKESVMEILGDSVIFAEQKAQLGTANAVLCAIEKMPEGINHVLVVNGDDSAFYKHDTIEALIQKHISEGASVTFITTERDNPKGIGRILRNEKNEVIKIIEEKDAIKKEKEIKEINVGCYIFKLDFLKQFLKEIKKNAITGEFYLTDLIGIAYKNKQKVEAVKNKFLIWQGINTTEDLQKAQKIYE